MFGIGFFELLVILGVAALLVDKESFHEILKLAKSLHVRLEALKYQIVEYFHAPNESKHITGDDDKIYEVYEVESSEVPMSKKSEVDKKKEDSKVE
ncbi:hypothetical protein NHE_0488 [Neorickettsia helminthoeca str. Oregon]|uniref:MttA/Hcf106 family protein n=1 Tax=Neorickettsia helminthoeca str. Oregon TaxID=1286528 RepID=X5HLX2_9RICK|nr:twin-arginine translocase TatA/TatE family subunit [Neorickettsia helminthoeca]AHX11430.1 hypothetical protein NHE_0488 [Neorickettsia helminthoeca str. Oregon]